MPHTAYQNVKAYKSSGSICGHSDRLVKNPVLANKQLSSSYTIRLEIAYCGANTGVATFALLYTTYYCRRRL